MLYFINICLYRHFGQQLSDTNTSHISVISDVILNDAEVEKEIHMFESPPKKDNQLKVYGTVDTGLQRVEFMKKDKE